MSEATYGACAWCDEPVRPDDDSVLDGPALFHRRCWEWVDVPPNGDLATTAPPSGRADGGGGVAGVMALVDAYAELHDRTSWDATMDGRGKEAVARAAVEAEVTRLVGERDEAVRLLGEVRADDFRILHLAWLALDGAGNDWADEDRERIKRLSAALAAHPAGGDEEGP